MTSKRKIDFFVSFPAACPARLTASRHPEYESSELAKNRNRIFRDWEPPNMGNINAGGTSRGPAARTPVLGRIRTRSLLESTVMRFSTLAILCLLAAPGLPGRQKKQEDYGNGLAVQVPAPESEVIGAVQEVVQDGMVQGSVEYNKDKYVEKAEPASASSLFPAWTEPGTVFYKVRKEVLAPTNFKD